MNTSCLKGVDRRGAMAVGFVKIYRAKVIRWYWRSTQSNGEAAGTFFTRRHMRAFSKASTDTLDIFTPDSPLGEEHLLHLVHCRSEQLGRSSVTIYSAATRPLLLPNYPVYKAMSSKART